VRTERGKYTEPGFLRVVFVGVELGLWPRRRICTGLKCMVFEERVLKRLLVLQGGRNNGTLEKIA
jgi:hypothetical protein